MSNQLAVLMSSCDAYADLWDPFFSCLERFSHTPPPYSAYVNTEKADYRYCGNISVTTLHQISEKPLSWSRRMLDVLERIPEPYIFLLLDDFFACDTIRWEMLEEIMDIMDRDSSIASFQLYGTRVRNAAPEKYEPSAELRYHLMDDTGWKTHFVPTVWRKEVLMKWLRPWESIWAFESCGSARARRWHYKEKVYVVESPPVYDYLWIKDCSAVINGKWLNEPELKDFFAKNDIPVDYSTRGQMTHAEYLALTMKDVLKRYTLPQIAVKSFNRFRSLF